jgi:hypothetical protein
MERARHGEVLAWIDGNKPRGPRAVSERNAECDTSLRSHHHQG